MTSAPVKINNVGLAVTDIEAFLRKTTPLYEGPMIVNELQKVRELFITYGATTLELLEPLGEGPPLRGFLNRQSASSISRSKSMISTVQSRVRSRRAGAWLSPRFRTSPQ